MNDSRMRHPRFSNRVFAQFNFRRQILHSPRVMIRWSPYRSRTTFQGVQHQGTLPTTHHGLLLRFQLRLRERHVHMCRQVRVLRLLHVLVRGLLVHLQPRLRGLQEVEHSLSRGSRNGSREKYHSGRARGRARERCFRRGPSERVRPCRGHDVHDRTAPIV